MQLHRSYKAGWYFWSALLLGPEDRQFGGRIGQSVTYDRSRYMPRVWRRSFSGRGLRGRRSIHCLERYATDGRALLARGIDFQQVAALPGQPDADAFNLLCHLAFNAPMLTRRQRAERVHARKIDIWG